VTRANPWPDQGLASSVALSWLALRRCLVSSRLGLFGQGGAGGVPSVGNVRIVTVTDTRRGRPAVGAAAKAEVRVPHGGPPLPPSPSRSGPFNAPPPFHSESQGCDGRLAGASPPSRVGALTLPCTAKDRSSGVTGLGPKVTVPTDYAPISARVAASNNNPAPPVGPPASATLPGRRAPAELAAGKVRTFAQWCRPRVPNPASQARGRHPPFAAEVVPYDIDACMP
jgi:hypothetical protein